MTTAVRPRGLLDTNVVIVRRWIDEDELPAEVAISAVTLAELSAGVHHVRGDDAAARAQRASRIEVLRRVEGEFDPIPFDADAARAFGRVSAAVLDVGRSPRRRVADLMIASVGLVNELPVFTTNPVDYVGLEDLVEVVALTRPPEADQR